MSDLKRDPSVDFQCVQKAERLILISQHMSDGQQPISAFAASGRGLVGGAWVLFYQDAAKFKDQPC